MDWNDRRLTELRRDVTLTVGWAIRSARSLISRCVCDAVERGTSAIVEIDYVLS
ncbi:hypothetical protein KOR42_21390 [Thalassoglobus neptunius]|uniref:Uncharacterized protein n=1 Tax=Thalassoglobus neptunius TaxID=1938619 RepID=A0A5C5X8X7_9PLAN|nr:hypothetical protein KOR42_21390 [Thalassoglobus neptunius]